MNEVGIIQENGDLRLIGRAGSLSVRRQFREHDGNRALVGARDVESDRLVDCRIGEAVHSGVQGSAMGDRAGA